MGLVAQPLLHYLPFLAFLAGLPVLPLSDRGLRFAFFLSEAPDLSLQSEASELSLSLLSSLEPEASEDSSSSLESSSSEESEASFLLFFFFFFFLSSDAS